MAAGKKNAARLGAHIVFADESGFLLIPTVRKTWAPRGHTPVVRHRYRHDRISVISGVSVAPRRRRIGLYFQAHEDNIRHDEVCAFLRHLPPYAPQLNPDEAVWAYAKGKLANGRSDDLPTLHRHLRRTLREVQGSQRRLRACIHRSELLLFLL